MQRNYSRSDLFEFFAKYFYSFFESYYKNYEHYIEIFFFNDNIARIFLEFGECHRRLESKSEENNSMMKKLYSLRNDAMLNSFNCSQQIIYKNYLQNWISCLKEQKLFDEKEWNELIDHIINHKNIKKIPKLMKSIQTYRY